MMLSLHCLLHRMIDPIYGVTEKSKPFVLTLCDRPYIQCGPKKVNHLLFFTITSKVAHKFL